MGVKGNGAANGDDAVLAQEAILKFPNDKVVMSEELFTIADRLAEDAQAAAQQRSAHDKRLEKLWGLDKRVMGFLRYLEGLSPGRRLRAHRQYVYAHELLGLDNQLDLPFHAPGSREPELPAPVMDETAVGARLEAEREDEPAPVVKRQDRRAPARKPSADVMPMASFRAQLEAGNQKVDADLKRRRKKNPAGKGSYSVVG